MYKRFFFRIKKKQKALYKGGDILNFYHTWVYKNVINADWLLWIIVILVLGFNVLSPVILWGLMNGRSIIKWGKGKKTKKKENEIKS